MRILITAGPTCEDIDPVRFLTNRSSGRMGYALAERAMLAGHDAVLISGPTALPAAEGVEFISVRSASQMLNASREQFPKCDACIFCAAVADYQPAHYSSEKIHKADGELTLRLERTEDIAATIGKMKGGKITVGFAMESQRGRENAMRKLEAKNFDMIVLNRPETMGSEHIHAEIIHRDGKITTPAKMTKPQFAHELIKLIENYKGKKNR